MDLLIPNALKGVVKGVLFAELLMVKKDVEIQLDLNVWISMAGSQWLDLNVFFQMLYIGGRWSTTIDQLLTVSLVRKSYWTEIS